MRRLTAPVVVPLALVVLVAIGCATSREGETHGPVYDGSVPIDVLDGSVSEGGDATTPGTAFEASAPAGNDASGDAANGGNDEDAGDLDGGSLDAGDGAAGACGSPTVVLAGNGSSLVGAVALGGGPFTTRTLTGSAAFAPALVATAAGFEALVAMDVDAGGGGALFGLGLSGGTWGSPVALGAAAGAIDAPAIAAMGTTVQGVYLNPQNLYLHAQFNGTSWDTGADKVEVGSAPQSFGPVRASAAASATELVIAYEGNDGHLYAQSWTGAGGWQAAVKIGSDTLATNTAPAVVALAGDSSDFLVVYAIAGTSTTNYLDYALRTAATKTWGTPAVINATAYTPYAPSLAPMSGGGAIVGWRGGNNSPYTMAFTPSPSPAWTAPVPIASVNVTAAPSLATGTCGNEAVAALATNGTVTIATYANGAWVPSMPISGISGASFAAIATSP
jgi:hypothetical protein